MTHQIPQVEFITERKKFAARREQTIDLLIRIVPPEPDPGIGRRPKLNLSMVLDRSGSMSGEKMDHARRAAMYCIDQLLSTDRISVVIFDDVVETLINSCLAENKSDLKERISTIMARNSTALHEAWVRGGLQISQHLDSGAINRVLLITDGLANVGLTNTDEIVSQSKGLAERGVSTSTIGIGGDFNEDLLLPMATAGGGNAWHVEHADDMQRIFAVELEGLIAQIGHSVSLGMIPSDGVRLVDVLNDFEMNENGRYKLPNLQAGSPIEVVVQLKLPAQPAGMKMRLFDLRLGFTPQDRASAEVIKHSFEIEFDTEESVSQLTANPEVAKAVRLLMNARARREAMKKLDTGDLVGSQQIIAQAVRATYVACAPMASTPEVQQELEMLNNLSDELRGSEPRGMTRKKLSYQSYLRGRSKPLS
ncbi:MAG TPA: VWA domain-containing protein [Blastocatellia bacterium]|nr:VWA domain-containing protein [Blastocatellia bacterium]